MSTTDIATRSRHAASPMDMWTLMREQAGLLIKTGFLPQEVKTAEQAVAIMMKGSELGIPSMYALSNIAVVKGKPTCSAELMLALIYRDHGDQAVLIDETNARFCRLRYKRRSWTEYQKHSFTIEEAQTAGLAGQDTWKKYAPALLRARAISSMARMAFPDSIGGMYTPEELGASVFTTDGETFEVTSNGTAVEEQAAEPEAQAEAEPETPRARLRRLLIEAPKHLTTEQRDAMKAEASDLLLPDDPRKTMNEACTLDWAELIGKHIAKATAAQEAY